MPFITQKERTKLDKGYTDSELTAGQRCYLHYLTLKDHWNSDPRWSTADWLYREVMYDRLLNGADQRAKELAWQVFFQLVVIPYEKQKLAENGDIN